ncbi:MAG: acetylglucosaminyldiphospho-UDP acetyl-beta-D-mannosaminyltransferase [Bacillales bacterium]|jgi:N-acetylglucosaminyldiphosphoundecaprenol N-acetyl-beta-D-mannosaminyltransferase|nr:acetylglucosaminyldiphospho-UDP acetyl-beta-D-mannosaminyltransferase [Bacillales bacterium]
MDRLTTSILGIQFNNFSRKEIMGILRSRIHEKKKTFIVTANPEICLHASLNPDYKEAISTADYIMPDGIGVVLVSKFLKVPLKERVPGFDLMLDLLELADKKQLKIYLLGAKKKSIEKAIDFIRNEYPSLIVSGYHHGYINDEDQKTILKDACEKQPDLIFVAKGYPKQEMWISNNLKYFQYGIFIGVGGSVDVLAGEVKRAPDVWQNLNLEWFYRLIKQPTRWRRTLKIFTFIGKVFFEKRKDKKRLKNLVVMGEEEQINKQVKAG